MKTDDSHTYRYRFGFRLFFSLIIGFALLGSAGFLLMKSSIVDNTLIVVVAFLTVIGLTHILLTTNYLIKSLYTEIRIDSDIDLFEIVRKGKKQIFKLGDIVSVDIQEQSYMGLFGRDFEYAKYTFADGRQCIVTALMTDSYYIPAGREPRIKKTIFPFIWEKTIV